MKRAVVPVLASVLSVLPLALIAYALCAVLWGYSGNFRAGDTAECGLVFGAAVHARNDPGPAILRRVEAASDLYHGERVSRLIFSGGKGDVSQQSEASVMYAVAVQRFGVPDEHLLLEEESTSTWENMSYARPLLQDCSSVVGISDRYHLSRIALIARKQGITLQTYPVRTQVSKQFEMKSVVREIAGYMYYLFY